MWERFNQHAWKACIVATLSRVRIPLSPPQMLFFFNVNNNNFGQNVHEATFKALNDFKGKECKIGRARMFAEKSKDLNDPGMFALNKLSAVFIT